MKKLLVFSQDLENCVYCRQYQPTLDRLAAEGYDVEVIKAFDADGNANELNNEYGVKATPTSFIIQDNKALKAFIGPKSFKEVSELLKD